MKPWALMTLGSAVGVTSVAIAVLARDAGHIAVLLFAAGALFGKGYGVWEERGRNKHQGR